MSLELIQPDYNNDFNYPSLNRKDLMYLDSLNSRDCPIRKIDKINTNRKWSTNLYNLDIDKSVPNRPNIFTNKIDFINKVDDIEKARPNKEVILNKPDFILNIRDIEKAYPKSTFWKSQRHINPLNPVYKLPTYKKITPKPLPKFIRNQIDISDIEKTKPKKLYPLKMRPFKNYDDIKGVHPRKPYERKEIHDSLNLSDINIKKKIFRNTNPLDPEYDKPYGGYIDGTKPLIPFYYINFQNGRDTLNVEDINGTMPGSSNNYRNFRYDNKQRFDTRDIEGAYADTKKYGIITKRCTDPLQPNYQYIGNNEMFDCFGEMINNGKNNIKKKNPLNMSMSNPNLKIFDDYNKNDGNEAKFKYNNSNNLAYSQDFFNIAPKTERLLSRMEKSLSCGEIKTKIPFNLNKDKNKVPSNIYDNLLNENEKNESQENYNYQQPFPHYEYLHDPSIKCEKGNKENRLDYKLRNMKRHNDLRDLKKNIIFLRNHDDYGLFENNNNSYINDRRITFINEKKIVNNGMGTLYNKLYDEKKDYESKLDDLIKRKDRNFV